MTNNMNNSEDDLYFKFVELDHDKAKKQKEANKELEFSLDKVKRSNYDTKLNTR